VAFAFSDRHIEEYRTQGFTIFRQILPISLVTGLRRVCDEARDLARTERGPQAQRLQPITNFPLDQQPFLDYVELPALNDAIHRLLSPAFRLGGPATMGVLFEPADLPWCTAWHRDWRDNMTGLDLAHWDAHFTDDRYFNQVNCALYADTCTWVVPGSHLRRDLPREIARFPARPISGPNLDGKPYVERESACLEYVRSMPGAQQLHLDAGDFCLYRNTLWHIGNYLPYARRATLHDSVDTDEFMTWRKETLAELQGRREAGHGMENPNT
jgi:hypothetical protein